jgi:cyclophilin family peptidyl-prolyl cis-trans isomerase
MNKLLAFVSALVLAFTANSAFADNPRVKMMTSKGEVIIELFPDKAPLSVENFLRYTQDGAYNGSIFHRVIKGFMNQGGGFSPDLEQLPAKYPPIKNEADNGLKNKRGTLAMARTAEPDSATSQFFVNTVDNSFLDHTDRSMRGWGYAVFGEVVAGMEVMDAIAATPTGAKGPFRSDVPLETIEIISVEKLDSAPVSAAPATPPGAQPE